MSIAGAFALGVLVLSTFPDTVGAEATSSGFALNRYAPSFGTGPWSHVAALEASGHYASVYGDYAYRPLVLRHLEHRDAGVVVAGQLHYHATLGFAVSDRVRLGVQLPVLADGEGNRTSASVSRSAPVALFGSSSGGGVGDPVLALDVGVLGTPERHAHMVLGLRSHLALGREDLFQSDGRARVEGRVMAAAGWSGLRLGGHVGLLYHAEKDDYAWAPFGAALTFGIGTAAQLGRWSIAPEVYGRVSAQDYPSLWAVRMTPASAPVEGVLTGKYTFGNGLRMGAGLGRGLTHGLGAPELRALLGFEWAGAKRLERSRQRSAPTAPPDRDADGVSDLLDNCPGEPGQQYSAYYQELGCPDTDGDAVADAADACPALAGARHPTPLENGCPVVGPDSDGDGIHDVDDACPSVAGVSRVDRGQHGCPLDSDQDGVVDRDDACLSEAGEPSVDSQANGCPKARLRGERIVLTEPVHFVGGGSSIEPRSTSVLEAVAALLLRTPELRLVRIEGHTDDTGQARRNRVISERRARSVLKWLVARGVPASRLTAVGLGSTQPLTESRARSARQANRRVEFLVLQRQR